MEIMIYSGTPTWTVPVGTSDITVECWGAGGNGRPGGGSGGGAGGCYARSRFNVVSGTVYNLTWGYSNASGGSATIFGPDLVSAPSGGTANNGANGAEYFVGSHIYNEVGYTGGFGGAAGAYPPTGTYVSGGGGGAAGSTGNGNNTTRGHVSEYTIGGAPKSDYGGGGGTWNPTFEYEDGKSYGGGGSGGKRLTTIFGAGAPGLIRITTHNDAVTNHTSFFPFF